ITLSIIISIASIYFQNGLILMFVLLILAKTALEKSHILFLYLLFSPFLYFVEYSNFASYFIFVTFVILFSSSFSFKLDKVFSIYLLFVFPIIISLCFLPQSTASIQEIMMFKERLYPEITEDFRLQPNQIALLAAICCFICFIKRKFLFFAIAFLILLWTQSRSGLVFLIVSMFFSNKLTLKRTFLPLISILIVVCVILLTPIKDRFVNYQENGRLETYALYYNMLNNAFPFGYPISIYESFIEFNGAGIDNLYLFGYLSWGVLFFYCFFLFIFSYIKNTKDEYFYIRRALFFAFLVHGIVESSLLANVLAWIIFAMCFNSFNGALPRFSLSNKKWK
ncbi:MAG: hypothetical protein LKF82_12785, partial [Acinetobacter populi]|uniref:hypothetical protein n=1 Tax=Acinetobacter populi TaxID=1582270 RepID=UPI0023523867